MRHVSLFVLSVLAALAGASSAGPARAAESYDGCTGDIATLPVVLTLPGTWCMKSDLGTSLASGAAITVSSNNVTIDCNGFRLSGLAAGTTTQTSGVRALGVANVTLRNCSVRGFRYGLEASGSGFVVEANRFEGNTQRGITLAGDGNTVRGNFLADTAGATVGGGAAYGIYAAGSNDIIDNTIDGVVARAGLGRGAWGVQVTDDTGPAHANVENNRVRGVLPDGTAASAAVRSMSSGRVTFRGNSLFGSGIGSGIVCVNTAGAVRDNTVLGFATGLSGCGAVGDGGNVVK